MSGTVELLLPVAEARGDGKKVTLAPRLDTLSGKRVALLSNGWLSLDITYQEFRELLRGKYEVAEVLERKKPSKSSPLPGETFEEVAGRADAVISALGA